MSSTQLAVMKSTPPLTTFITAEDTVFSSVVFTVRYVICELAPVEESSATALESSRRKSSETFIVSRELFADFRIAYNRDSKFGSSIDPRTTCHAPILDKVCQIHIAELPITATKAKLQKQPTSDIKASMFC